MRSLIANGQFAAEELKMFLEADLLEEIK